MNDADRAWLRRAFRIKEEPSEETRAAAHALGLDAETLFANSTTPAEQIRMIAAALDQP